MTVTHPPLPTITRRGVLIATVGWLLYSTFFGTYFSLMLSLPLVPTVLGQLPGSVVFGLFSIPVWLVVVRRLDRAHWSRRLGAHALLGPAYMAATLYVTVELSAALSDGQQDPVGDILIWQLLGLLFTYMLQFALFHIVRSNQKLRWREKQQRELELLLREQELAVLRSQLNPHFLFNSLNTISAVLGQDTERARELIARLGDVLRYAVDSVDLDSVALGDEWQWTGSYLDVERARLGDRLQVVTDVNDDLLPLRVPPMVLQPLVENAIVHGIAPNPEGGRLSVRAWSDGSHLCIAVENDGAPATGDPDSWESEGTALRNIRARLRALYGESAGLDLTAPEEGGFRAVVRIPTDRLA